MANDNHLDRQILLCVGIAFFLVQYSRMIKELSILVFAFLVSTREIEATSTTSPTSTAMTTTATTTTTAYTGPSTTTEYLATDMNASVRSVSTSLLMVVIGMAVFNK